MGQLLSSLFLRGSPKEPVPEFDFDIAEQPLNVDEDYNNLYKNLIGGQPTLIEFKKYKPATESIRDAISKPTQENIKKAVEQILPTVEMLKRFHVYSSELLEENIPKLLDKVASDNNPALFNNPNLAHLFAKVLNFVLEFDNIKMNNSNIQNDFSYYRRTLKQADSNNENLRDGMEQDEEANKISLFIAPAMPMLASLIGIIGRYINKKGESIYGWMTKVWAVSYQNYQEHKANSNSGDVQQKGLFYTRTMVAVIMIYDYSKANGVYSKGSPIDVLSTLKLMKGSPLISTLKYNSKHFNDESTPKAIKEMAGP